MTTCLHWDHTCIPDRCRCWPFHMSDRRRGLLTSCRHLGNIGRRGLGGRLWRNPWGGFVSQMLSDHSFSYMDLPLSGGLETSLHLQKGKIWYLLRNEIWTWPLNTNSTLCYFFMYLFSRLYDQYCQHNMTIRQKYLNNTGERNIYYLRTRLSTLINLNSDDCSLEDSVISPSVLCSGKPLFGMWKQSSVS